MIAFRALHRIGMIRPAFGLLLALSLVPASMPTRATAEMRMPTDVRVAWSGPSERPRVALTFDDGPNPSATGAVLDLLRECGAKGTFFLVGQRLEGGGEAAGALVRRMRDEGHEIGNHSWSHPNISRLSHAEIRRQIERTQVAIDRVAGVRPTLFRPPGGALDFAAVRSLAGTEIRDVVMWSVDPSDWARPGRDRIWRRVADAVQPGSIILLHDTHGETLNALPLLLDLLQARGYELVTVSELLHAE